VERRRDERGSVNYVQNCYCVICDKLVRINEALSVGSRFGPVRAEIAMNDWDKKVRLKGDDKLMFW